MTASSWAFDIETLGQLPLSSDTKPPPITCVCLYDGTVEHALCFHNVSDNALFNANRATLLNILDSASVLIGYNAIRFDLPYIQRFFDLPPERLARWVTKTIDPYLFMRDTLGITCSLATMLALNRLPTKSASGLIAIVWAKQGRMDLVIDYCMMDTKLTHALCGIPSRPFLLTDLWTARWETTPHLTLIADRCPPPAPPPLLPIFLPTERLVAQDLATVAP
jgi:hypothetical protein